MLYMIYPQLLQKKKKVCLCEWTESAREHMKTNDKTKRVTLTSGDFGYKGDFCILIFATKYLKP